ncbi:type I pantothenate kinase [Jeotgalibacillus proteolyticus]|uniref:Pantothenate kinase n=1 Tax=Jeotgalibacillus proteolyticus TaxID=2082395 RepID=A0A2S5GBR2_9BACL|nr:type I pantothenate kinase [Jeotgalibacillus proteolyticus]PPA70333.1 type I pantothenate kinase [Jeotgalibacillus proteolyticus]
MTKEQFSPYITYSREEWARLQETTSITISEEELEKLEGIYETLSVKEITEVYLPLVRLLSIKIEAAKQLHALTDHFLQQETRKVPYILGIAGSVSVGKSTTARALTFLLSSLTPNYKVDLVTTDGFLYPNQVLEEKGIMNRKGFPESYNVKALIEFLTEIKSGNTNVRAPVYSHLHYNVIQDDYTEVVEPDVVILEGVNVLQTPIQTGERVSSIYVSDFFDLSLYIDAEEQNIANWYVERFKLLKKTAFTEEASYFKRYANLSDQEAEQVAKDIWNRINKMNLELNIRPTKGRADIIIEKGNDHKVSSLALRKL